MDEDVKLLQQQVVALTGQVQTLGQRCNDLFEGLRHQQEETLNLRRALDNHIQASALLH